MDRSGIELAITSLAQPGVQFADRDAARTLARRCNDYAAELSASAGRNASPPSPPCRCRTLATPSPRSATAATTLRFCRRLPVRQLWQRNFWATRASNPVLEALDALGAPVFVHPAYHPSSRSLDLPWPGFMMEYLFDTTRAAVNLLLSGALDRFPRIRFILAHAGGVLPYFAWRLSVAPMIDPRLPQWPRERILAGLRRYWYDIALSPAPGTMAALNAIAAPERILYGSDWPFANARVTAAALADYTAEGYLTQAQHAAIDRGNALALFTFRNGA